MRFVDETMVIAPAEVVVRAVSARWSRGWRGLRMTLVDDRGPESLVWAVSGALVGTSEVRLVPGERGVLVQCRLEADPAMPGASMHPRPLGDSPYGQRAREGLTRRYVLAWKAAVWSIASEVEA